LNLFVTYNTLFSTLSFLCGSFDQKEWCI